LSDGELGGSLLSVQVGEGGHVVFGEVVVFADRHVPDDVLDLCLYAAYKSARAKWDGSPQRFLC
jgi:hypothetical protein